MSTKVIFVVTLVGGLLVAGTALWLLDPMGGIQSIPPQSLSIPVEIPIPKTVETQIASLVEEENIQLAPPTPVPQVAEPPAPATPEEEVAVAPVEEPTEPVDPQVKQDKEYLSKHYSEFAYIEFAGYLSTRKMATFHNNLTREKEKVLEGGEIHGIHLDSVAEDHVMLSYGQSGSVRKPRVDLEVVNEPGKELTEEEQKARRLRYEELFGNRFKVAAEEANPAAKEKVLRLPSPAEEEQAKEKYRETYGRLFYQMSTGSPTVDMRDVPNGDLNLEDAVKKYFETHWPGQVEVSTEGGTSPEGDTSGGTSEK